MTAVEPSFVRCVARSSRTGEPCRKPPIRGGTVCASHGGRAPQVKAAAARRLEEQRVTHELGLLLVELEHEAEDLNAVEILIDAVRRAHAMVQVLGHVVGKLGESRLVGPDHLGDLRQRPEVAMYREWTGEAARLAKLALDAGVEQRQLELMEDDARALVNVLLGATQIIRNQLLDALGDDDHGLISVGTVRRMLSEREVDRITHEAVQLAWARPRESVMDTTAAELEP